MVQFYLRNLILLLLLGWGQGQCQCYSLDRASVSDNSRHDGRCGAEAAGGETRERGRA